jgi:hypothetical protein
MKRSVKMLKIAMFLIIFSVFTLLIGCAKEKVQTKTSCEQIPGSDYKISSLIKCFKARGESGLKSGYEMTIDSAKWYIGTAANYTYGDASRETEQTFTDSCFVNIPLVNGKIPENDVYVKYEEVINNLRIIYYNKNEENKQLLSVSVKIHSIQAESLIFKVTGVFAYGGPIQVLCVFNEIDSWSYWKQYGNGGICGGINWGTHPESDAAEETQKRIMACKGVPQGNYYYEELPYPESPKYITNPLLYPIFNGEPNNYRYSHLYWNSNQYPNPDGCIPPGDLNFYLTKTKELIYNDTEHGGIRPVGSSLISIDMYGNQDNEDDYTIYEHNAIVDYGILRLSPDPKQPL